jgi:hypothetical protein
MSQCELSLKSVGYRYSGGLHAVKGIDLDLGPGILGLHAVALLLTWAWLKHLSKRDRSCQLRVRAMVSTALPLAFGPPTCYCFRPHFHSRPNGPTRDIATLAYQS